MNNFVYWCDKEKSESYSDAYDLIKKRKLIIDVSFLPIIQDGENFNSNAWLDLFNAFSIGNKHFPKSYEMARYYCDKLIDLSLIEDIPESNLDAANFMRFDYYRLSGKLELSNYNYDLALEHLKISASYMINQVPIKDWKPEIFDMLTELKLHFENLKQS